MEMVKMMGACCAIALMLPVTGAFAQTSTTGELTGTITDQTGAAVPGASASATNLKTHETRAVTSGSNGVYTLPLLDPGPYSLRVSMQGFKTDTKVSLTVNVAEIDSLNVVLQVGAVNETVEVTAEPSLMQTGTSALGNTIEQQQIQNLPLVTRNFTQILGLSAGVTMPVTNAAEVGRGSGSSSSGSNSIASGSKNSHGNRQYDNNFQIDGITVNDNQSNGVVGGVDVTGGVPTPNPDALEEFKVQTAQYDATFGHSAGAQINVITKAGTAGLHASLWEYFRNEDLNANDWFRKLALQPRGRLRQNQFGGTVSGPLIGRKVLGFGSYQETKQSNGVAAQCSSSAYGPAALTNNRSAATLGSEFAGVGGALGGTVTIAANGSNINPIALELLQFKLPNGSYLVPTPQVIVGGQGFSSFSVPCSFSESQFDGDLDYIQSSRNVIKERIFWADGTQTTTFPSGNVPGFTQPVLSRYRVGSLTDTFTVSAHLVNEALVGYHSSDARASAVSPVSFPQLGIPTPVLGQQYIRIGVNGAYMMGSGYNILGNYQQGYNYSEALSYTRAAHVIRVGVSYTRQLNDLNGVVTPNTLTFQSFGDFLLGLPGGPASSGGNGSSYSNVYQSQAVSGVSARNFRQNLFAAYFQDDWKLTRSFTLNLGVRYEFLGAYNEINGRNANFNLSLINPNPPAAGTLAGLTVASNFPGGASALPAGVTLASNPFATNGGHPNSVAPRLGFSLQESSKLVLRGGYGMFYSVPTLQALYQTAQGQPWQQQYSLSGAANINASFQTPFVGANLNPTFPLFAPYSPTTSLAMPTLDQNYRPALIQTVSLSQQMQLTPNTALELGYVGSHGQHLMNVRYPNAAGFATPANPIRGITSNSTSNIAQRVPFEGFSAAGSYLELTEAENWYNGLEATLRRRLSHNIQALVAYTWQKDIDTEGPVTSGAGTATAPPGNPFNPLHGRGLSDFDRRHRLVASYLYQLPKMKSDGFVAHTFVNGWKLAGVTTIQTGAALTVATTNAKNYSGITSDLVQLSGSCAPGALTTSGKVSSRITNYFNTSCFAATPIVDGSGSTAVTGFGNGPVGSARGPDQDNTDLSLNKVTAVNFPHEGATVEFRTDFFNVFNLPQFANPGTSYSTPTTFGHITSSTVSPRVVQFAMRYNF